MKIQYSYCKTQTLYWAGYKFKPFYFNLYSLYLHFYKKNDNWSQNTYAVFLIPYGGLALPLINAYLYYATKIMPAGFVARQLFNHGDAYAAVRFASCLRNVYILCST